MHSAASDSRIGPPESAWQTLAVLGLYCVSSEVEPTAATLVVPARSVVPIPA